MTLFGYLLQNCNYFVTTLKFLKVIIEKREVVNMGIKDLKSGMMVKLRNNDELYVFAELGTLHSEDGDWQGSLKSYSEDLTHLNLEDFSIDEVWQEEEVLWERKKVLKITEDEKVILRNADKKYKYISRDSEGYIELSDTVDCKVYSCILMVFNHIFKSITFENSPILIDDLL